MFDRLKSEPARVRIRGIVFFLVALVFFGVVIAHLIITRQIQKDRTREYNQVMETIREESKEVDMKAAIEHLKTHGYQNLGDPFNRKQAREPLEPIELQSVKEYESNENN